MNNVAHETASDWAKKEIAGAAQYREWVGEDDEMVRLSGKVFPYFMAARLHDPQKTGLSDLDIMDNMRRLGQAHVLQRGDGWHLGWYVIERLTRGHTSLGPDGIGREISFDATFQRVPVPIDPAAYFQSLWGGPNGAGVE